MFLFTDIAKSKVTVMLHWTIMCIILNCECKSVRCCPLMYHCSVQSAFLSSIHYSKMPQGRKTEKKGIKPQKMNGRWKETSGREERALKVKEKVWEKEIRGTVRHNEYSQWCSCSVIFNFVSLIQHDLYKLDIFMNCLLK